MLGSTKFWKSFFSINCNFFRSTYTFIQTWHNFWTGYSFNIQKQLIETLKSLKSNWRKSIKYGKRFLIHTIIPMEHTYSNPSIIIIIIPHHFIMVQRMNVFVDRISSQFDLRQSQMNGSRFRDVHDFPVRRKHEDEPVQRLQEMRAQLLQDLRSFRQSGFHAPTIT